MSSANGVPRITPARPVVREGTALLCGRAGQPGLPCVRRGGGMVYAAADTEGSAGDRLIQFKAEVGRGRRRVATINPSRDMTHEVLRRGRHTTPRPVG